MCWGCGWVWGWGVLKVVASLVVFPHSVREEGFFKLWKGVTPAVLRHYGEGVLWVGVVCVVRECGGWEQWCGESSGGWE